MTLLVISVGSNGTHSFTKRQVMVKVTFFADMSASCKLKQTFISAKSTVLLGLACTRQSD